MAILALYVPKPSEFSSAVVLLGIVFVVLCAFANRLKLSVGIAALGMLAGGALALTPDLISMWNADLGSYGNMAREWSSTNYSDRFFVVTSYLHVGRGKVVAFSGMGAALILHTVIHRLATRNGHNDTGADPHADSQLNSSESAAST